MSLDLPFIQRETGHLEVSNLNSHLASRRPRRRRGDGVGVGPNHSLSPHLVGSSGARHAERSLGILPSLHGASPQPIPARAARSSPAQKVGATAACPGSRITYRWMLHRGPVDICMQDLKKKKNEGESSQKCFDRGSVIQQRGFGCMHSTYFRSLHGAPDPPDAHGRKTPPSLAPERLSGASGLRTFSL